MKMPKIWIFWSFLRSKKKTINILALIYESFIGRYNWLPDNSTLENNSNQNHWCKRWPPFADFSYMVSTLTTYYWPFCTFGPALIVHFICQTLVKPTLIIGGNRGRTVGVGAGGGMSQIVKECLQKLISNIYFFKDFVRIQNALGV